MAESPASPPHPVSSPAEKNIIRRWLKSLAIHRNWGAIQIAMLYALISGVWVIFSDQVAALLVSDPATLLTIHTLKSWGFIVLTALLLYGLIRRHTARLLDTHARAIAAVQAAEEKYRDIVENAIEGIFQTTPDGRFLSANPALARIYGYDSSAELISNIHSIADQIYVDPDRRAEFVRLLTGHSEVRDFESAHYRQDGRVIWVRLNARAVRDAAGAVLYYEGTVEDITDRKHSEEALREASEFNQEIINSAHEGIIVTDRSLRCLVWNPFMEQLSGLRATEVLGQPLSKILPDWQAHGLDNLSAQALEGETHASRDLPYTFATAQHSGWAWYKLGPMRDVQGDVIGAIVMVHDITTRKRNEEVIQRLAAIVESSDDAIIGKTLEGVITSWNLGAEKLYGYAAAEMVGRSIDILLPPDRRDELAKIINHLRRGERIEHFETVRIRQDGQALDTSVTVSPIRDSAGQVVGASSIARDITERKRAEEAERDQRALSEALRDTAAALNSTLEFDQVLDLILENVGRVVPSDSVVVMLCEGVELLIVRWTGLNGPEPQTNMLGQRYPLNDFADFRQMVETKQPVLIADVREYPGWVDLPSSRWIRSYLGAPILIAGQVVGMINLNAAQPGQYTTSHTERLQAFTHQAAVALQNARLLIEAQARATDLKLSQDQLRAVSARAESVREEERITIAREIHDDLGQSLTGLKMDLAWLTKHLPASKKQAGLPAKLQDMSNLIDQLIQAVRRIATELRPGVLDDLGLIAAIEWQAADFQRRTGIVCKIVSNVMDGALNKNQATAAFRILLETLTNIARHAQATHIKINLKEIDRVFTLEVRDNGRGLPVEAIDDPGSLGLAGMRERALAVGGQFSIAGAAEGGTLMRLSMPLEQA
jgi:PAS domain S-box-containing protein